MKLPCEYPDCPETFSSAFNRKRHVKVCHLGLRPFQCSECFKYFASKQNLREHQFMHTSRPPSRKPETEAVVVSGEIVVPKLSELVKKSDDLDLVPMLHVCRMYPYVSTKDQRGLPALSALGTTGTELPGLNYIDEQICEAELLRRSRK